MKGYSKRLNPDKTGETKGEYNTEVSKKNQIKLNV